MHLVVVVSPIAYQHRTKIKHALGFLHLQDLPWEFHQIPFNVLREYRELIPGLPEVVGAPRGTPWSLYREFEEYSSDELLDIRQSEVPRISITDHSRNALPIPRTCFMSDVAFIPATEEELYITQLIFTRTHGSMQ